MKLRLLPLLISVLPSIAYGQSSIVSRLDGLVLDPSGRPVSAAAVKVVDQDRGTTLSASSGEDGFYRLPRLSPGRYEVTVAKAGFRSTTQSDKI